MKLPFLKSSKTTEAEVSEKIFGVEINKDLIDYCRGIIKQKFLN